MYGAYQEYHEKDLLTRHTLYGLFNHRKRGKQLDIIKSLIDVITSPPQTSGCRNPFYKNGGDIVKRMRKRAFFEKVHISCSKEVPLKIEEQCNPPFNVTIGSFKGEVAKLNRHLGKRRSSNRENRDSKKRILKSLRCGLATCSDMRNSETLLELNFYLQKFE